VTLADILPTICEVGGQRRSLTPSAQAEREWFLIT